MLLRHTLLGSVLAAIALVPIVAQAQTYYYEYRSPTIVYESTPPVEERVTRYWDSDRGVWVERRIVPDRSMHWVPDRRVVQPDGSIFIENGHWEYDR